MTFISLALSACVNTGSPDFTTCPQSLVAIKAPTREGLCRLSFAITKICSSTLPAGIGPNIGIICFPLRAAKRLVAGSEFSERPSTAAIAAREN